MGQILAPVHVRSVGGRPLRMFASPAYCQFRQADLPWHSADDLRALLGVPDELRRLFEERLGDGWRRSVRTVATVDGITTIAPHRLGEEMIRFMQYRRQLLPTAERRRIRGQFRSATTAALMAMTGHLSAADKLGFFLAAR